MKIAYLSTEYPPAVYGGLGVYVDAISRELSSLGCGISVFTFGGPGLKRRETRKKVTAIRETPVPMKDGLEPFLSVETMAWGPGLPFLMDLLSYNQLSAGDIVGGEFDLCVAHDWLGLPGAMAVRRSGLPMIYHVHGTEVGRSASPNRQLVELERLGAQVSDCVLTVSNAMAGELISLGVNAEKIRVCHHGVDASVFDPAKAGASNAAALRAAYGISEEESVILFVGRLEPVKGVMQLLSAMPAILEKNPNVRLLIVGKGSLEATIRQQASTLGEKAIIVTDFLSQEDKVLHYAISDVCVFPSIYEPFGIVALEAAAMGKPAVVGASGVSGLREIVEPPHAELPTGVHVDPRRPEDIAWGISLLLEDPDRRASWGKNARARCLNRFTWARAGELTLDVYKEVMDNANHSVKEEGLKSKSLTTIAYK